MSFANAGAVFSSDYCYRLSVHDESTADGINALIALFTDIPVLWLETNHYTTFLPK